MNWKAWLGYLLAGLALLWVFHDVEWAIVLEQCSRMSLWWLVPAIVCDVMSYVCEGQRWSLLLRPVGYLPLSRSVQAIYAGLFANEVLPLRFGEVVRAYLASRWTGASIPALLPSMAVGRLFDGAWLVLGLGILVRYLPLPDYLARGAGMFGIAMVLLFLVFVVLVVRPPRWAQRWKEDSGSRLLAAIGGIILGIGEIGLNPRTGLAGIFSLLLVLLQAAAFWFVMIAAHLPLGYPEAAAVFLIVHLGTALPNAPANIGSFQFFTVLGLQLFGIEKSAAAGFSVVVFLVLTLPLWGLGLIAISRCGVRLEEMKQRFRGEGGVAVENGFAPQRSQP